jgi:hypothetical protein
VIRPARIRSGRLFGALVVGATLLAGSCARRPQEGVKPQVATTSQASEQALFVHLRLSDGAFGSREEFARATELESVLEEAIARAGVGELDGNEVGGGEFVIYTYGPDADRLREVVQPLVLDARWPLGGRIRVRRGPPGEIESVVVIPSVEN